MNNDDIKQIILDARSDPALKSTLNIETILKTIENVDTDHLGNRSLSDISSEIFNSLKDIKIPDDVISEYCSKLSEYRLIDQLFQLQKGKHIRWIRIPSYLLDSHVELDHSKIKTRAFDKSEMPRPLLTNGGIVVDIKFTNAGTQILCKNKDRFVQYKFDDCLTFQKLSDDEQLLLSCYEIVKNR
jgi:hypothetical protein